MYKISRNNDAMVGIDLMVALALMIAAVIMAILIIPSMSHDNISQEDKSDRIMRYMAATRASDSLVQDDGGNWEAEWKPQADGGNYSNVTKIGLVYVNASSGKAKLKVLNRTKVEALMGQGYWNSDNGINLTWWEFPNNFTPLTQEVRDNASRALGLSGYNFYMQLHPVGLNNSQFNLTPLKMNLTNRISVPIDSDVASAVDRYVYIRDYNSNTRFISYKNATGTPISVHYRLNLWVW